MYNKLLKDYGEDLFVYIVEGCKSDYVSLTPPSKEPCPNCGDFELLICRGLVKDIKESKDFNDLEKRKKLVKIVKK